MSRDDQKTEPLRALVRETMITVEEHKKESSLFREKMLESMARIDTHIEYSKEQTAKNTASITVLNDEKNTRRGVILGLLVLGGVSLLDFIKRLFS